MFVRGSFFYFLKRLAYASEFSRENDEVLYLNQLKSMTAICQLKPYSLPYVSVLVCNEFNYSNYKFKK